MIIKQEWVSDISFLGMSDIGESHVKNGKPNQDAVGFLAFNDSFVVAVSDGVGSCENSHIGSQTAILACKYVLTEISDKKLPFNGENIAKRLAELWTQLFPETVSRSYSATLKAVFGNGKDIIAVSIGDGLLFILSGNETLHAPNTEGDFVNETHCLSHGMKAAEFWTGQIAKLDDTVIFLSTDGVSNGIKQGCELEFINQIAKINDIAELEQGFKDFMHKIAECSSDDKTIGFVRL
jgi:serine/threonine protein phosphatase PrpC